MDTPMPTMDTTTVRGLLMLSLDTILLDMDTPMPTMDTTMARGLLMLNLDTMLLDMDIPMPTMDTTMARGLLMLNLDTLDIPMPMAMAIPMDTIINLSHNVQELRLSEFVKWVTPSHCLEIYED